VIFAAFGVGVGAARNDVALGLMLDRGAAAGAAILLLPMASGLDFGLVRSVADDELPLYDLGLGLGGRFSGNGSSSSSSSL